MPSGGSKGCPPIEHRGTNPPKLPWVRDVVSDIAHKKNRYPKAYKREWPRVIGNQNDSSKTGGEAPRADTVIQK